VPEKPVRVIVAATVRLPPGERLTVVGDRLKLMEPEVSRLSVTNRSTDSTPDPDARIRTETLLKTSWFVARLNRIEPDDPVPGCVIVAVTPPGRGVITVRVTLPVNPEGRVIDAVVVREPPAGRDKLVGDRLIPRLPSDSRFSVTTRSTDSTPDPDARIVT